MGQALYRRYRSKNLDEIIGQEHITKTLSNTLKRDAMAHAYLLTGPRGVGKTSIARILAHEINNLPYESEKVHLDIIEIDAASNRRIDEIRELRDKVHTAPTSATYKVYIIDEVHMLTKEAFNALLKTLEEPPKHVVFILATTDVHKLPETIISRTQHFTFKPIPADKIAEHLKNIAKKEKIDISDQAIQLLASHGRGSFRDSIGLLDQVRGITDKIDEKAVRTMLGVPSQQLIDQLHSNYLDNNIKQVATHLHDLYTQGFLAEEIAAQLAAKLRQDIVNGNHIDQTSLLVDLLEIPASREPNTLLEITLIKHMRPTQAQNPAPRHNNERPAPKEDKTETSTKPASKPPKANEPQKTQPTKTSNGENTEASPANPTGVTNDTWRQTLDQLKETSSTLYSVARMAEFSFDDNTVTLGFAFPFHKKRIESNKNKQLLHKTLQEVIGTQPQLEVILVKKTTPQSPQPSKQPAKSTEGSPIDAISNIFGGAEVLES